MWVDVHNIDELQEGDVIEFVSKVPDTSFIFAGTEVPFVLHYGIVLIQNGIKKLGHNTFQNYPKIDDIAQTLNGRQIKRVCRTGMKSEDILNNHNKIINIKYDVLKSNCEDYVFKVTGIRPGIDQRAIWIVGLVIIIMILILVFRK